MSSPVGTELTIAAALEIIKQIFIQGSELASLVRQVQLEGRSKLNVEEWKKVLVARDAALMEYDKAINVAEANGGGKEEASNTLGAPASKLGLPPLK